ncbi:MAG: three-Cys-motif partner protein TcmP, partial [Desulfobacterales bacterium]|nr:three-Cys-motif partner protein TcmP [Desulfobacterales bacterium]
GKNGQKDGSPFVLLDVAKKILDNEIVKSRQPNAKIVIVFSDVNEECCSILTADLKKLKIPKQITILGPYCESFESIKTRVMGEVSKFTSPKFFFLDPFAYSAIGIDDIKGFMNVPAAEVLLFLPIFHSYRFIKCANDVGVLKKFLEDFSEKGCSNYVDINDFIESIRQKILRYIDLKYARYVVLDDGARKNALFYLTKHVTGMLLMNNLSWKYADDGVIIKVKNINSPTLFNPSPFSKNYNNLKVLLKKYIIEKKRLTNVQIIDFVAKIGFATKYAREILKEMKNKDLIRIKYKKRDKKRGFYVADGNWNEELATIIYQGAKNGD